MLLSLLVEVVLGTVKKHDAALFPILVLLVKNLCEVGQVEPHHLDIRVGLDEAVVGPPKVVDCRNQSDPRLDLHLWCGVGGALHLPFPTPKIRISDPSFIYINDASLLLQESDHHLGILESEN